VTDASSQIVASDVWVEVVEPLSEAMHVLAGEIARAPGTLEGVVIAVQESGSFALNRCAWATFHTALKRLGGLKTRHVLRDEVRPVRFLLLAAEPAGESA
jgi:hypothetical protein